MKYAIISDLHGNLPALNAVLEDVSKRGITEFIFAGDYCLSSPYPDQVITAIRNIKNKHVIRGNEEHYLESLVGKDQSQWTDGQMQISYWNYRNISEDNRDYLLSQPVNVDLICDGVNIHITHTIESFIGENEFRLIGPGVLAKRFKGKKIDPGILKKYIISTIENDERFMEEISELEDGIYIFGHSHVQWSYKVPGKDIYLINPGSCGLPLDGIENTLPYTILDIENGNVKVEHIRVYFDLVSYSKTLKDSTQFKEANVWTKIIMKELSSSREKITFFIDYVNRYANDIGDNRRPFAVDTWETAYDKWEKSMSYVFYGNEEAAEVHSDRKVLKGIDTPLDLYDALTKVWCKETCAPRMQNEWTPENMTYGQCSITSFLVQDIFGGIVKGVLLDDGNYHCYNVVDGHVFDLTSEQFEKELIYSPDDKVQIREEHFRKEEKRQRYEHLKEKLFLSVE